MTKLETLFEKSKLLLVVAGLLTGFTLEAREFPRTEGNCLWTTQSGEEFIDRLLEDIAGARECIEIEYYWFASDRSGRRVRDALIGKAREGVPVRVVMDNLISPLSPESFYEELRRAGAKVLYVHQFASMSPWAAVTSFLRERDHRKVVVIDGRISYTGGINFYDKAVYEWKDTQIRLEGPVSLQMRELFLEGWEAAGGEALPSPGEPAPCGGVSASVVSKKTTPSLDGLYVDAINAAKEYFYIQTPYFAPPPEVVRALKDCAGRGVDVRLLIPLKSDWEFMNEISREYLPELRSAGIRIYVQDGYYDHSKLFVTDDALANCGTINLDYRSLVINWENTVLFYDRESIMHFKNQFLREASSAREQSDDLAPAKGLRKLWRSILRKLAPMF